MFLLSLWSLNACNLIDKPEPFPAYIHIAEPRLVLPNGDTVSGSLVVPDVWIFQNADLLGAFSAPVTVPTLDLAEQRFFVSGGIFLNGNTDERQIYPFWYPDTAILALSERDTAFFQPIFSYRPDTVVETVYEERFEDNGATLEAADFLSNVQVGAFWAQNPFEGRQCWRVLVDSEHPVWGVQSASDAILLPRGRSLWVEVTYRGNLKFGLQIQYFVSGSQPGQVLAQYAPRSPLIPVVPPSADTWQTVYFDIRNLVANTTAGSPHKLVLVTSLPEGRTSSELFLDNIRILAGR